MRVKDLTEAMALIAPVAAAEPWDNVGLLCGDPAAPLSRVLLTIDLTRAVLDDASRLNCQAVVAYHPPIFKEVKRLLAGSVVFDAVARGMSIYSPHTALDSVVGGTNDVLADAIGMTDRQPVRVTSREAEVKLVTFVPADAADRVADALFAAGAGRIGDYSKCSFRSDGTGTFVGHAGSTPAVGSAGVLERVPEVRVETVLRRRDVGAAVAALRANHPYEEPAFDLVTLSAAPSTGGMGRIGRPAVADAAGLINMAKASLGLRQLLVAGPKTGRVDRAAALAGSCGELLGQAIDQGATFILTGETRHHDALAAAERGVTVVSTLHSNSERPTLARLGDRLARLLPHVTFHVSRVDADPFSIA